MGVLHALAVVAISTALAALDFGGAHWRFPVASDGPAPAGSHPLASKIDAASCGQCHLQPYMAWQRSLHARSFSPGLAGQLPAFGRDEQQECLRCHAPRAEQLTEWFGRTLSAKLDGVDCATCHARNGVRFGPRTVDPTPHGRVEASALFARSEFCAVCHQFGPDGLALNGKPLENTFDEWKASRYARENRTCQSCHMPGGRHEFRGIHDPEMTRAGLFVRARRSRGEIRLTASNAGAGHHLPTYTTPLIRLEIRGDGVRREHVIRRELAWDARAGLREVRDTRLAAGENVSVALKLAPDAAGSVVVTVDPGYDYHARIYPDLLVSADAMLSEQAKRMLHSARNIARDGVYVLYRLRCEPWRGRDADCAAIP